MSISVKEYIEDKDKLELSYLMYGKKVDLVDIILENVINRETSPATIDTALLKNISLQMFIQNITNIDLSVEANDGENGYDILCYTGELQHLLELVAPEFNRLEEILNDKLNDFYRYEYSSAKALYDIRNAVYQSLSSSADILENALKNIDVEKLVKMMPTTAPLKVGDQS